MPLGDISVFSSTSILSTTSTRIGVSPASFSVRVALMRTSDISMAAISTGTSTETMLSRTTVTVTDAGLNPMRVMAMSWRPLGRMRRATPSWSVTAVLPADCTRKPPDIPIDSSTVTRTVPLSGRCATAGAAARASSMRPAVRRVIWT